MANSKDSVNVLFVCLGNICKATYILEGTSNRCVGRSTMAEGVFRSLTKGNSRIGQVDSCGTGAYHELDPPDSRTMDVLKKNGITDYDHAARKVIEEDFDEFDYVFAMDSWNLKDLQQLQKRAERKGQKTRAKVMLFGEFSGKKKAEEVEDPYYGGGRGFDIAYEQVRRFTTNFLKSVDEEDSAGKS